MAKFYSYYVLCPLIDQNSFLGVTKDKEPETVVVTLGRNVVNKYRLSDQKQTGGWTSKDHITSAVIYDDEQESYVGVFNQNTIKAWKDESENLDKLKKYKFSAKIFKVLARQKQTSLIIFENGNCASLPYGVDNRLMSAHKPIIKDRENIIDVGAYTIEKKDYICYVIKNTNNKKKEKYEILISPLRDELGDLEKAKLTREKVVRSDDVYVVGHLISTNNNKVYFLWSDSKLSVYDIKTKSWKNMVSVPWISTLSSVSIACMEKNHLIMFGSNTEEDGAILVAYDVVLGVGSCRYPLKMYTTEAKLYSFNNRIILQGSNHIAMLPYMLETDRNISSLLGSHNIISENVMEIVSWDASGKSDLVIGSDIKHLWLKGLAERTVCSQIMSALIEKDDFEALYKTLLQFTDIPESLIVSLIVYTVSMLNSNDIDVTNDEEIRILCLSDCHKKNKKGDLLKYLLQIPFSDALIIAHLRQLLSLDDALLLISFIAHLIMDTELDMERESKIYDWCILLLDTFYQQFLMTNDPKVTYVLQKIQKIVESLIHDMQLIDNVMPLLGKMLHGTPISEQKTTSSYVIDLLNI
ncbi:unnamed protein product [Pieris macdunnoughi]|uniref:Nucleolar protein 11 n=1 Tax=Pieris macdunnoughi TaxID=345717 RepID=A0A821WMB9_9NEOP|nr:unnamed protein product [Pieris macdunnoughi]